MNSEEQMRQAQQNFKTIADIKDKLEILEEHVESRKEALEEEIEEAVADLEESVEKQKDAEAVSGWRLIVHQG